MPKVILTVAVLIIIVGAGYYFLRGSGAGDTGAETMATSTPVDLSQVQGSGSQAAAAATASPQPTPAQAAQTGANTSTSQPAKVMSATLHTNMGDITIEFYPDQAPQTVANFIKLAQSGFYDGTKFHRVIKGFMDQGGDPLTKDDSKAAQWGMGGPGYTIPDEFGTTYTNVAGTVAMANTGAPNSGGSQFFFNAVDNHFLDGKYAVFGKVTSGMDVVTKINNVQTAPGDRPLTPVVLESVTLK